MQTTIKIPAEDLTRQYQQIQGEIAAAIDTVLSSGKYTLGPNLEKFESEFAEYCIEAHKLVEREPEILKLIDKDLDHYAREKKRLRILDRRWEERGQPTLPTMEFREEEIDSNELRLGMGRPRMSAYVVYMFMMGRGYYGGIKGSAGDVFTSESMTLHIFLENQGLAMPSKNSI